MSWSTHYPINCPPSDLLAYEGYIYRHLIGDMPTAEDFISFALINPTKDYGEYQCQACGLSIFIDEEASLNIGNRVPSLRGKKVAKYLFQKEDGAIKHTPSRRNDDHHTFWVDDSALRGLHSKFVLI